MSAERQARLDAQRRALVDQEHIRQYHEDPSFHLQIDMLAEMVVIWVDAMAVSCARLAEVRQAAYQQALAGPEKVRSPFGGSGVARCARCGSPQHITGNCNVD